MSQRELFDQDRKTTCTIPNINILELGFLHTLQRRVAEIKESEDLCTIVNALNYALKNYDVRTFELVLQALLNVVNSILVANGGTTFPCC